MVREFLGRLLVALPIVSVLAVLFILALKHFWPRAGGGSGKWAGASWLARRIGRGEARAEQAPILFVHNSCSLSAGTRLVAARFHDRDFLIGVAPQHFTLLASADPAPRTGMVKAPGNISGDAPGNIPGGRP